MNRPFQLLISCGALLLLPALSLAGDGQRLKADAAITQVTVYQDRAMTQRSATIALNPGSYLIVFDALPAMIQDDSVRVTGSGSAAAAIAGIEIKKGFLPYSGEQRIKDLDEEIRLLERKIGGLDARKSGFAAQRLFLDSIRLAWGDRISKELAVGKPSVAELMDVSGFVGKGVTALEEQQRDTDHEKQLLLDKRDALLKKRDEAAGSGKKESKNVEVAVEVSRGGKLTLELSSVTPQAGWESSYDVRLNPDRKSAALLFRALVYQKTGEDWNNVALNLSTARPSLGGTPPQLLPWMLSLYRPAPPQAVPMPAPAMYVGAARKAGAARGAEKMMMAEMDSTDEVVSGANILVAQQQDDGGNMVSFRLPRPVDVPSDGTRHGAVVANEEFPVTPRLLAVPKLSPYVYLTSEIVNKGSYPLLPGKVAIFSGPTYTGSSYLKKVAVGETFDLSFGIDDSVTVKREALKQHEQAGLFGKNRMSYRYRIDVANLRNEVQDLEVMEQLPVAADTEINVALDAEGQKPAQVKQDGTLVWKLALSPREKREVKYGITVEYPKERQINGL